MDPTPCETCDRETVRLSMSETLGGRKSVTKNHRLLMPDYQF
jgi:hypothetical protein